MSRAPNWEPTPEEIAAEADRIREENDMRFAETGIKASPKPKSSKYSLYRGVSRDGGRWAARIASHLHLAYLGRYDTEIEAARAYDRALVERKIYSHTPNFPEEMPQDWLDKAAAHRRPDHSFIYSDNAPYRERRRAGSRTNRGLPS